MIESWLEEYDELARDVSESNYHTFALNVRRWLDFIDAHEIFAPRIAKWEADAEFKRWFEAIPIDEGTMGGTQLDWPRDTSTRLGLQLGLFRALGSGEIDIAPFALHFMYVDGDFHVQVANITRRLFMPFARERRRAIQRLPFTMRADAEDASVEADSVVLLDRDGQAYKELVEALEELTERLRRLNDYPAPGLKERHIAELSAGRELLKPDSARRGALWSTLRPPLLWLAKQFAGTEVGHVADLAWKWLSGLLA